MLTRTRGSSKLSTQNGARGKKAKSCSDKYTRSKISIFRSPAVSFEAKNSAPTGTTIKWTRILSGFFSLRFSAWCVEENRAEPRIREIHEIVNEPERWFHLKYPENPVIQDMSYRSSILTVMTRSGRVPGYTGFSVKTGQGEKNCRAGMHWKSHCINHTIWLWDVLVKAGDHHRNEACSRSRISAVGEWLWCIAEKALGCISGWSDTTIAAGKKSA
jgi:hypothetical protein